MKRATTAIVSVYALSFLLTACGGGGGGTSDAAGSAAPPTRTADTVEPAVTAQGPAGAVTTPGTTPSASVPGDDTVGPGGSGNPRDPAGAPGSGRPATTRCHTSELTASVGRVDPGAGQENFPVVLTNTSSRTCTVRGYPGAAFTTTDGRQLGPDPRRQPGTTVRTVTLAPGRSAWAGLRFANPEISEARTAVPAVLLVTPPDEREPLEVPWKGGKVPVGGNESVVWLSALSPGTAP